MRARQQGVAIVLALTVVALAALAVTAMMVSQSIWSRRVALTAEHAQARQLVQAGLDWSRAVLSDDRRTSTVDYLGEPWALRLPPIPVENGSLTGRIEDQQGKFNLNNLLIDGKLDLAQLDHFRHLLAILGLPPTLAGSLADWIDADSEPQPQGGAEDAYYLSLPSPYLAANRPLIDVAELALVRGFDDGVRARLRPFVTTLPRFTPVNVNTAPPEVIAAMVDGLSLDDARMLVARRDQAYFRNLPDFFGQLPKGLSVPAKNLSASSDFFLVTMQVTIGAARARGVALLDRENDGWPAIVWRKYP
ncbi:MAG: general secretion pathway protein GspK [Rhodanobacter sp.]|nr:MAG: general secretion pathway protein GspK [Rhodanobacter sp.]TAL99377.1 MAG: general secretion pathway protein GspK [Rhodanobacter sp.]TAM40532.1 MAG: general secretion pathway protein GspK [Rhodanobacter sp.]TAN28607.1 MAG: general secretion pathway protein GspK [Rhodanobacter sp.]